MKNLLFALLATAALLMGCVGGGAQASTTPVPSPAIAAATPTPSALQSLVGNASASGGNGMENDTVQKGDNVAVDYVGTLDNGTVFDTSLKAEAEKAGLQLREEYAPLEFTVGAGQMIAGFDSAVVGMKVGEEKKVRLEPSEAYGERDPKAVVTVNRSKVPAETEVGATLYTQSGASGIVLNVTNESVTIDFNNPMAGKALNFRIILRKLTKG